MLKIIGILILSHSVLLAQDTLCKINKNNITQILEFGINQKDGAKKGFELCDSFNDTLTFSIDENNCDILEGQSFSLKNNKVATYRTKQSNRSSLIIWQPRMKQGYLYIDFITLCGGQKKYGLLKATCENNVFDLQDISFIRVNE